jgi:hypothetical protein
VLTILFNRNVSFNTDQKKFIFGQWNLRYTNDKYFDKKHCYIIIKEKNEIKLKTIFSNGYESKKISQTGKLKIKKRKHDEFQINLNFNRKSLYSHTLVGIKIPEIQHYNNDFYFKKKSFHCKISDRSLYLKDVDTKYFYIFDLESCNANNRPDIEMSFGFFMFSQIFAILLGMIIQHIK